MSSDLGHRPSFTVEGTEAHGGIITCPSSPCWSVAEPGFIWSDSRAWVLSSLTPSVNQIPPPQSLPPQRLTGFSTYAGHSTILVELR